MGGPAGAARDDHQLRRGRCWRDGGRIEKIDKQVRMFLAAGMGHCGGGDRPNTFDMLTALDQWVENGKTPEAIIASHITGGKTNRTRPLCAWSRVATYSGRGSIDDAVNFVCK